MGFVPFQNGEPYLECMFISLRMYEVAYRIKETQTSLNIREHFRVKKHEILDDLLFLSLFFTKRRLQTKYNFEIITNLARGCGFIVRVPCSLVNDIL